MEYRLRSLEFQNGARIGFVNARMLYNEDEHIIAIEQIGAPGPRIDDVLDAVRDRNGDMPELKTIYYDMMIDGEKPIRFYHPIKRGADVRLMPRESGRSRLFFAQSDGAPMFSKDYTLRDVSEGKINSSKAVWQFHGYKHER